LVVERASGIPYRTYMTDRLFGPAGLTSTTFEPAAVVARGNATDGHLSGGDDEIIYAPDDYDNDVYAPAGYAFSTAGDLVRWALLLSDGGGGVLSAESAAEMQTLQQDLHMVPGAGYGYGIFVEPFYDLTVRQHGGNIWGWGAMLLWHAERRFAVAVLANTYTSLPGAAYCIADAVLEPDHGATPSYPVDPDRQSLFYGPLEVSVNTGWALRSPYPVRGDLFEFGDGQLGLHMWDNQGPWTVLWMLEHLALDVYGVDLDSDGAYDLDVTFITSPGPPEQLRWMRIRPVVGTPERVPRSTGGRVP
jgi:CubicO group peptidase (beta-lactamase class C family)